MLWTLSSQLSVQLLMIVAAAPPGCCLQACYNYDNTGGEHQMLHEINLCYHLVCKYSDVS
jgi:hypothetical protein